MSADTFVDTNILIYAHDLSAGDKHQLARRLVSGFWKSGGACISVQVLQELYVNLTRKVTGINQVEAAKITISYAQWRVQRPTAADVRAGIELHQRHKLSFWDAMIVISASKLGCSTLLTEDLNNNQLVHDVKIHDPFVTT